MRFFKSALLLFAFSTLLFSSTIYCQTLVAGDIAFIGFNEDLPTDGFSIITLNTIPGSQQIYFTDQGIATPTTWVANGEDHWRFTAPASGIPCGTVISFTEDVADIITITGVSGATMTHLQGMGLFNLSSGDQMIAYTVLVPGVPVSPSTATFLAAITTDDGNGSPTCLDGSTGWSYTDGCIGTNVSRSLVPPGLTNGVNCISIYPTIGTELDNSKYNGTLTGTSTTLRAAINNRSNWDGDDVTNYNISPSSYPVASVTCVAPCTSPTIPTVNFTPTTVCAGSTATLTISGTLNDATAWHIYSGSCGGTLVGTTAGNTFIVTPMVPSTTYYVRGQGGCVVPGTCGSVTINTTPLSNASFFYSAASYCVNAMDPTPTISGVGGGTFSSTAGLSLNASTGTIDVSASTSGTYTITYTTPGPCPGTANQNVTINALSNAGFNYGAASYCTNVADPIPTISGLAGGTFTSSPAGMSINTSTGVIDVSASTSGAYSVTYSVGGVCPNSSNVSVTITALDNAGFNYSAASYCTNAVDPAPTVSGLAGGTFSSAPAGLSINASTGVIDVSASTPGTYTVTYTTSGPCPNASSVSVTINGLNTITLSSAMGSDAQSLLISTAIDNITYSTTGATGATFSGLPMGVMGVWAGDVVTISGSPSEEGIFNYTVTLTGGCGTVTASGTITVATCNLTLSSAPGTFVQAVCVNDPITDITYTTIGATGATVTGLPTGVTGTWAANVVTISGTPNTAVGSPFNYTVTLVGGGCSSVTNGIITVSPSPDVSQPSNQVVCNDGSTSEVLFTGSEPGTDFNWTNSDPTIGLAVNGTGNIPSFTATNAGTAPIVATITVTPSLTTSSAGNALNFDGVNDQAISSLPPVFNDIAANDFTMEAWVYPTGSVFSRIIYAQLNTSNFASMSMGFGREIYFYVIRGGTTFSGATTNTIPLNQWTHVATKWTAGTNAVEVYFNGVLQLSVSGGGSSTGTSTNLVIGSRPGGAQYFPGILDEIRIWNTARTQVEISATMNSSLPGNTSGIEVYYKLDEGTGIATADASPSTNSSSLSGSPAWQVPSTAPLLTTCTSAPVTYTYTVNPNPSMADAGPDQTLTASMANLAASTPTVGTGAWTIESGAGGSVTTPASPTSTFIGNAGTTYTLRWTISNAPCAVSMDDVVIEFNGIAQIMGGATYSTLQDAIDAATPGQTIMLLGDVSEPNVNISNSVTINANGFTFTIPSGNLTIPIGNSLIWPSNNLIVALGANIVNNGTLCNNGIIDYNNPTAWTNTGLYKGTGTFNGSFTNNGTFSPGN